MSNHAVYAHFILQQRIEIVKFSQLRTTDRGEIIFKLTGNCTGEETHVQIKLFKVRFKIYCMNKIDVES